MDTGSLNLSSQLPLSITKYLQQLLQTPTNFGPAQRSFSSQYAHPSLGLGPTGSWLDPQQLNTVTSRAYLGERGGIAEQDLSNKMNIADLLTQAGGQFAQDQNTIPFLEASNISSGGNIFQLLGF